LSQGLRGFTEDKINSKWKTFIEKRYNWANSRLYINNTILRKVMSAGVW